MCYTLGSYAEDKKMSVALPNNKKEKWERYMMLVRQGSMSPAKAQAEYHRYLRNTHQLERR